MPRGFGVAAGLDPEVARPLAARCAELGYHSLWSNDHPGAKGLDTLAEFGVAAEDVDLGVAVIALDRTPPEQIAADLERTGLDPARLWLGVGAGFSEKPLTRMRESLPELRDRLPGVRLVLAAMGPKMCALAGAKFDGVFFNWMTPEFAARARLQVEAGAKEAEREAPPVLGYVRTGRPRRPRAPRQGGVLLPRPPRRLPQPLRPPRRARGHRRRGRGGPSRDPVPAGLLHSPRHDRRPRPGQCHGRGNGCCRRSSRGRLGRPRLDLITKSFYIDQFFYPNRRRTDACL